MKKIGLLLLLLITISVFAHKHHNKNVHECMHDQMDPSKQVPSDFLETYDEVYGDRTLQASNPQPMRISVDFKELDNPANGQGLTPAKKQYIKNIMEAAQIFLGKLIKVNRRNKPIKMTWGEKCYDMAVTKEIQDYGQNDSDLHIYVTYSNESNTTYLANAIWCQLDPNPVIGRIKFNIGVMTIDETSFQNFQDNFSISLHEILHILGFSGSGINYWIDPDTGKAYGGDNWKKVMKQEDRWDAKNVNKVFSKNILRVARNHYGCSQIDGMYLENQGGGGSMGSHWERDLLGNEFMTASIVVGTYTISEFTAALLLDTGYYAEINSNMLMPIFWGKNKGCEFFNKSCNSGLSFPEFPDPSITNTCDFHSLGYGGNGKYDGFSQCSTVINYGSSCEDTEYYKPDEKIRQNSGPGGRCFRSNAAMKGEDDQEFKGRCFKAKCGADNQSIEVTIWGTEKVNCKYPNQVINLETETKTSQGVMKCPHDFDQFCVFPKYCPNQCSNNGVCNNGTCICLGGWAGEDCSKQCPAQSAWDGSRCVPRCPSGQFKNNDNVCKNTCPYKYYKDANSGNCELCHVNCSICNGPSSNQCTACNNGYTLSGSTCVEVKCNDNCQTCTGPAPNQCSTCSAGKYLDSNKTCQPCRSPCSNCFNDTICTTCVGGYFMDNLTGKCTSNSTCDNSCQSCSAWRDPNSCTSCRPGYTLDGGKCVKCEKQCKTCTSSPGSCTECTSGYTFDAKNQRCYIECDPSCGACTESKNPNACTYCNGSKYLKNGQCLPCDSSCYLCKDTPTFCTGCNHAYKLDEKQGTCSAICRTGEFYDRDQTCKPCLSPCQTCQYYANYCSSCVSGFTYDKTRNQCERSSNTCHSTCNTCKKFNDDRACDSCRSGMFLQNGQCLNCYNGCAVCTSISSCQTCSNGFQLQNGQCVVKPTVQCHSSCKTCSGAPSGNKTFCTSCNDGLYLTAEQSCSSCQLPCKTCSDASNSCTSCDQNQYNFNSSKRTCEAKTCHPSCLTCTKPNDNYSCQSCVDGYFLKGTVCQPCSQSCKTCNNDPYQCTSCPSGLVLSSGKCTNQQAGNKCDPSCVTCFRDNDALACKTCKGNEWMQTNSDKSLARCLPCDPSCNGCTDTYRCTACSGENVLDSSNYCVPCSDNQKFQNGKCVDIPQSRKSAKCDYTCSTCSGPYYDQCTSCTGNRILVRGQSDRQQYCVCPQGTSDVNTPNCLIASNLQSNVQSTTTSTFAASAATSTIVSASTSNPVTALGVMEFSQSVSYLSYVNKRPGVGFDDTMNAVSYSHASNFINLESYAEQDAENERQIKKNKRLLDGSNDVDEEEVVEIRNPKFSQFKKTELFLINALVLIIINATVWAISGIISLINGGQDKSSLFFKLRRIYNISVPIVVFTLSSQEFSLLMFLQMLNLKTITGLQILSSVFSFLTLFYILCFTAFLFYCLEYKRVLCDQYGNNTVWQERFYLIHKYVKQNSFLNRNFVQITVLRKVIISFITACVVSSPIAQITLLLLCYTSYLIYLTISKPFKSNLYTVMMIVLDAIIILMHVLYCVLFAYEGDSEKEKVISLMMLFLTFSVFFAYLVYTLIIIGQICYSLYQKWSGKKSNQTHVKRPQQSPDHMIINQDINDINKQAIGPSSTAIQSLNQLDDKNNMIFSGEVLVKN